MSSLLKDQVGAPFVKRLAEALSVADKTFPASQFQRSVLSRNWKNLELKERIHAIVEALGANLTGSYLQQLATLRKVVRHFSGLGGLVFPHFVEVYGRDHWEPSVNALRFFTSYSSSEFAVRPFIEINPLQMLTTMLQWTKDDNPHVRRLASEGCRPRLPWSFKLRSLVADPAPILPILENLNNDTSVYVRKSVANNLNDISKDHPQLAIKIATKWISKNPNTDWIVKHGLRTLLKKGNPEALALFNLGDSSKVTVSDLSFTKTRYKIGSKIEFSFGLVNQHRQPQKIRIEYAIHYLKKNNSHTKKIFKITERYFEPGKHRISRGHSIKQMTTRKHYPGEHRVEIVINGVTKAHKTFAIK